jgi:uncharacterized protein (DUF58 family)
MERLRDDPAFLSELEYVRIAAQRLNGGKLLGHRRSGRFGSGVEYADFRQYVQGDDVRRLYWQAYLLHRRLVSKLYEESSELTVYLLVDTSESMGRGRPSKLLFAKKVAAAIGYVALAGLDRAVILPFSSEMPGQVAPLQGQASIDRLLMSLDVLEPGGMTDLRRAARQLSMQYRRRGLCVIISDFFDHGGYIDAIKILHHSRFTITAIRINEREEIAPSIRGDIELVDCETGASQPLAITPAVLASYQEAVERHYAPLADLCRQYAYDQVAAVSDEPFRQFVVSMFRRGIFVQ